MQVSRRDTESQTVLKHIQQRELFQQISRSNNTIDFRNREGFDDAVKKLSSVNGQAGTRVSLLIARDQHELAVDRH